MFCPRCESLLVVRSLSTSLLDRLLSRVSIYSFQCQMCWYRFRVRQRRARASTVAVEHRQFHRTPVQIPVSFEWAEGQDKGTITDISAGGCAIESKRHLRPGLLLRLQLPVGTGETPDTTVQQIVLVRSVHGDRAGVEFLAPTPQEQMQLTQTITRTIGLFANQ